MSHDINPHLTDEIMNFLEHNVLSTQIKLKSLYLGSEFPVNFENSEEA